MAYDRRVDKASNKQLSTQSVDVRTLIARAQLDIGHTDEAMKIAEGVIQEAEEKGLPIAKTRDAQGTPSVDSQSTVLSKHKEAGGGEREC